MLSLTDEHLSFQQNAAVVPFPPPLPFPFVSCHAGNFHRELAFYKLGYVAEFGCSITTNSPVELEMLETDVDVDIFIS